MNSETSTWTTLHPRFETVSSISISPEGKITVSPITTALQLNDSASFWETGIKLNNSDQLLRAISSNAAG